MPDDEEVDLTPPEEDVPIVITEEEEPEDPPTEEELEALAAQQVIDDGLAAGYQQGCAEGDHDGCLGDNESCTCPHHQLRYV